MATKMSQNLSQRIGSLSPHQRKLLEQRLAKNATHADSDLTIRPRTSAEPRAISFAQQRLWFLDQLNPGTATYNVPIYCRITGELHVDALRRAVEGVVCRHEVLRTVFVPIKGQPTPVLPKNWHVPFNIVDLRGKPDREKEAERLLLTEAAKPFNLARHVMLRALLLRLADQEYLFLHTSHHISWDLRSKTLFYRELSLHYDSFIAGRSPVLPELPIQYADYAMWQRRRLQGTVLLRLENYWKGRLTGAPWKLELPTDHPRPAVQSLRGAIIPVRLSADILEAVKQLSRECGATAFMTLLAVFKVFLFCYSGEEDLCVGSPVLSQDQVETEQLIGFFVNTVVLRTKLAPHLSLRGLIGRIKETTLGAITNQGLPFEKVVEIIRPPRDLSRMALFQVNFRVQGPPPVPVPFAGLVLSPPEYIDSGTCKFDLALELPSSPGAQGFWEYSTDLFEESTVRRMAGDFDELLSSLITYPNTPLLDIAFIRGLRGKHRGGKPVSNGTNNAN